MASLPVAVGFVLVPVAVRLGYLWLPLGATSPRICWKRMQSSGLFYREEPLGQPALVLLVSGNGEPAAHGLCLQGSSQQSSGVGSSRSLRKQSLLEAGALCSFSSRRLYYFGTGQRTASVELTCMRAGRVCPLAGFGCFWKATLHLSAFRSRTALRGSWACFF